MSKRLEYIKRLHPEGIIWISGLILLVLLSNELSSMTFCPFHNLGISFCPGCGLGSSIIYLTRFELQSSFSAHPLGIPALIIILHRIFTLLKHPYNLSERKING